MARRLLRSHNSGIVIARLPYNQALAAVPHGLETAGTPRATGNGRVVYVRTQMAYRFRAIMQPAGAWPSIANGRNHPQGVITLGFASAPEVDSSSFLRAEGNGRSPGAREQCTS